MEMFSHVPLSQPQRRDAGSYEQNYLCKDHRWLLYDLNLLEYSTTDGITAQIPSKEVQSDLGQLCMLAREMKTSSKLIAILSNTTAGASLKQPWPGFLDWHVIRRSLSMLMAELADIYRVARHNIRVPKRQHLTKR
jgi:hypothetical protein